MPAAKHASPIAALTPEHAQPYRYLMLQAYGEHPDAFTSTAQERAALPLTWWAQRLADGPDPAQIVLAAWHGKVLIGVAGISFEQRQKTRHKSSLFGMYVLPDARGLGLGRALVQAVIAQARQRAGVRQINLTVTHGNAPAQRLYERCGFVAFGVEPNAVAIDDGYVDKVHMSCNLTRV